MNVTAKITAGIKISLDIDVPDDLTQENKTHFVRDWARRHMASELQTLEGVELDGLLACSEITMVAGLDKNPDS